MAQKVFDELINASPGNVHLVDINHYYSYFGFTAIHFAARFAKTWELENAVLNLINAGANINDTTDVRGVTPLMRCASYSNTDSTENTVRIILNAGANINLMTHDEMSALYMTILHACVGSSTYNTVHMLVDAGAISNLKMHDEKILIKLLWIMDNLNDNVLQGITIIINALVKNAEFFETSPLIM